MPQLRSPATVEAALRLSDLGVLDRDTAAAVGVAVNTVRRWRRVYQREGRPRGQPHTTAPCPRCDGSPLDRPAYALLLGWYLGDGHIVRARRGVHLLAVFNDKRYEGLADEVTDAMARVKVGGRPGRRSIPGAWSIACSWKHWPCLFPQHGPGRKHERPIVLEPWQQDIADAHPGELLRGLLHSDGCRVTNWTEKVVAGQRRRYEYGRWFFSNESEDIRRICEDALDRLGVPHRRNRHNSISVARRDGVALLDRVVGPKT